MKKKWAQPNTRLHILIETFFKEQSCTCVVKIQPLVTTAEFCASSTALLLVSSNLGPSMAINIFHRCLVGSWPFAGACRFLAGLFTFFSRWPIVNQLRASGRTWFRFTIMIQKNLHCLSWQYAELRNVVHSIYIYIYANEWQESSNMAGNWCRQRTNTDLVWCHPPWPSWAVKFVCSDNWLLTPTINIWDTETAQSL